MSIIEKSDFIYQKKFMLCMNSKWWSGPTFTWPMFMFMGPYQLWFCFHHVCISFSFFNTQIYTLFFRKIMKYFVSFHLNTCIDAAIKLVCSSQFHRIICHRNLQFLSSCSTNWAFICQVAFIYTDCKVWSLISGKNRKTHDNFLLT